MIHTFTTLADWRAAAQQRRLNLYTDHATDYPAPGEPFEPTEAHEPGATMDRDGSTPTVGMWCPENSRGPGMAAIGWLADTAAEFARFLEDGPTPPEPEYQPDDYYEADHD